MQNFADGTASLKLPAALNIRAMTSVKELLSDAFVHHHAVTLEIADDSQVDLSFVQLIEAARAHAGLRNKKLTLKMPASGSLIDVLRRGGFTDEISLDTAKFWFHRETV